MPSPDFAGSSFANASSGDTDPVVEFNESSFGSPEQTFMGDVEAVVGAVSAFGKQALDVVTATDNTVWSGLCGQFVQGYSALTKGNIGMAFQAGKIGEINVSIGVPFGALFGLAAKARMGVSLMELADATLAPVGGKGNPLGWLSGSLCVPANKAGTAAGGGIAAFKGSPITSKAAADPLLSGYMEAGKTVTTSFSSTSMVGDAIAGTNMATASINGTPLGGSTSVTLGPTMSVASDIGELGKVSGQIRVSIPGAVGVGLGLVKNVYGAIYKAASYDLPGDPGLAGHPESIPAKGTPGNTGADCGGHPDANFFIDSGICDPTGGITSANMAAEFSPAGSHGRGFGDPSPVGAADKMGGGNKAEAGGMWAF